MSGQYIYRNVICPVTIYYLMNKYGFSVTKQKHHPTKTFFMSKNPLKKRKYAILDTRFFVLCQSCVRPYCLCYPLGFWSGVDFWLNPVFLKSESFYKLIILFLGTLDIISTILYFLVLTPFHFHLVLLESYEQLQLFLWSFVKGVQHICTVFLWWGNTETQKYVYFLLQFINDAS